MWETGLGEAPEESLWKEQSSKRLSVFSLLANSALRWYCCNQVGVKSYGLYGHLCLFTSVWLEQLRNMREASAMLGETMVAEL